MSKPRVTVWNEFRHERSNPTVGADLPRGMHARHRRGAAPARASTRPHRDARRAGARPDRGGAGRDGRPDLVGPHGARRGGGRGGGAGAAARPRRHGAGRAPLRRTTRRSSSALMGTTCNLKWREAGEQERLWVVAPGHPIADGLGEHFDLEQEEMYGESFDIPAPDDAGLRQLVPGRRGLPQRLLLPSRARQDLLLPPRPRDLPDLPQPEIQRVIANAVRWAAPAAGGSPLENRRREPIEPLG